MFHCKVSLPFPLCPAVSSTDSFDLSIRGKILHINRWSIKSSSNVRYYSSDLPSHTKVALPALSPTMESGSIISWEKKEGDKLNEGDLLAEIETDKATMGFETPEEGYLAKIIIPAGAKDVPIGKLLCIIVEEEADVAAFKDYVPSASDSAATKASPAAAPSPASPAATSSAPSSPPPPPPQARAAPPPPPAGRPSPGGRLFASPLAKRLASEQGLDLSSLAGAGSGPGGRVIASDLANASSGSSGSYSDIQLTGMRRTIAKRLTESKQTIPHYYLTIDARIDQLLR